MTPSPATSHPSAHGDVGIETTARPAPRLGVANHVGMALAALLALVDVVSVFTIADPSTEQAGQNGPPAAVLWFALVMGTVTLVSLALAWSGRWRRPAVRVAAAARVLSAVTALPAFFVGGVPAFLVIAAAATVLLTLVAVALMLLHPRHRA